MKNLISVIIPIYNISPYLDRCISSVVAQSYRNLQVILVDDGSTDGSSEICDQYAKQDERIQVIHKPNGGLVSARKAGLRVAIGEYVAYVDGDDWIEPKLYERMLEEMTDSSVDLVETDAYMEIGHEGIPMRSKVPYGKYDADKIIPIMLCDEEHNQCRLKPHVWSKLFRRELLEGVQFAVDDRITVGEDAAVIYPYILHCNKISVLEYTGYHYVQHSNSMLREGKKLEFYRTEALICGLQDFFVRNVQRDMLLPQLNEYAKLMMLNKHVDMLDSWNGGSCLMPFGGIGEGSRVIIYGAGNVGQSIYHYLKKQQGINVAAWLDAESNKYQQLGMNVLAPEMILKLKGEYDKVLIAVYSQNAVKAIKSFLIGKDVLLEDIVWFTNEFLQFHVLGYFQK